MRPELISTSKEYLLQQKTDAKDNNREVIKQHVAAGCIGPLSELQEKLLLRWQNANHVIQKNTGKLHRSRMAELIAATNETSVGTAKADMVAAEDVFDSSLPLNKRYVIQQWVETLTMEAKTCSLKGDSKTVAVLGRSVAALLKEYPAAVPIIPSRTQIFNLQQNIVNNVSQRIYTEEEQDAIIQQALNDIADAD